MPNKGVRWKTALWKLSSGISVRQFCRETGAKYQTIWQYINNKEMSVDDACALAIKNKGKKDVNSKLFYGKRTLRSYCNKKDLNYHQVYWYYKKGLSIKDALTFVENKMNNTICKVA